MKLIFTTDDNKGLDSVISPHFGRTPWFTLIEIDDRTRKLKKVEGIENPFGSEHGPGQVPEFIYSLGADLLITGGMGPRAKEYFKGFNIEVITGAYGKVRDVLEEYFEGVLESFEEESEHEEITDYAKEIKHLKKELKQLRREVAELKSEIRKLKKESHG